MEEFSAEVLDGELCPFCNKKTLTLREATRNVEHFGNLILMSMQCKNPECNYFKSDVETEEVRKPVKLSFEVESEDDLNIRVIKSSNATVKIPRIGSIEPGEASNGYVTNIEGVLNRIKTQIEKLRDDAEDPSEKKKAKNLLKKITKVMYGRDSVKIQLDDPTGNSDIVSDKTVRK